MKIIGIIPARYNSSRLPGKPLMDICGKPMVWWVYQQAKKVKELTEIYIATDDIRIKESCDNYGMNAIMTNNTHETHLHRIHEVSNKISADLYVCICGDEPLIDYKIIHHVIPKNIDNEFIISILMREISDPTEVIDSSNIKIATNFDNECILLSRSPIPYPYKSLAFKYKKIMGVECFNKKALDFFVGCKKGEIENIEDITLLRFLENRVKMNFNMVDTYELSVDTHKDLEKVISILENRL